jgi:hypothetical protein
VTPSKTVREPRKLVVIGDIHAQEAKFWHLLRRAGLADDEHRPTARLRDPATRLVLLGDLVHAKTRAAYAALIGESHYDEFHPPHLHRAEQAQEAFLGRLKAFCEAVPGQVVILMGNHDHSAATGDNGPLRSDDLAHLEWLPGYGSPLPEALRRWMLGWPSEVVFGGVHLAHVGPYPEHNRFDAGFYLENRRDWILEDRDLLAATPYRLGIYGHTPVRGGVHFASRGRALLLDMNGYRNEYAFLELTLTEGGPCLELQGCFFSERL